MSGGELATMGLGMKNLSVVEYLSQLPEGEKIYYRANPGNAGDALIAAGAFILFRKLELDVEIIDLESFDATDKIVLYAGGGNLVGIYPEAREFFRKFHMQAKTIILLPHTVKDNEDLLAELGSNAVLFARELVTFKFLKENAINAKVYIDHDLAFNIEPKDFLDMKSPSILSIIAKKLLYKTTGNKQEFLKLPRPKMMFDNTLFEFRGALLGSKVGNFFREDVERALSEVPAGNADLSVKYEYGTRNDAITDYTTSRLMKYVNRFDEIRTDRLHICIASALMGKKVSFYPNSYFKCRAVYEYSLKEPYPNVTFFEKSDK